MTIIEMTVLKNWEHLIQKIHSKRVVERTLTQKLICIANTTQLNCVDWTIIEMYIKSVILDGFKSYGKRTEINEFDREFTAITGLNGTGKSNILDSICFVLGITNLGQVTRPSSHRKINAAKLSCELKWQMFEILCVHAFRFGRVACKSWSSKMVRRASQRQR